MKIKTWILKKIIRNRNKKFIISNFDFTIHQKNIKGLTIDVINAIEHFYPFRNKKICIDVANPNSEYGITNLTAEQFRIARKNHFQNLPTKPLINWDIGINNLTHSDIEKVHPNILFKKHQILITLGKWDKYKSGGLINVNVAFERIHWLDTKVIQDFCVHLQNSSFLKEESIRKK